LEGENEDEDEDEDEGKDEDTDEDEVGREGGEWAEEEEKRVNAVVVCGMEGRRGRERTGRTETSEAES
jgi:hypothetical protein